SSARCLFLRPHPRFFFLTDPPNTEIYTLSLHDALPIFGGLAVKKKWWTSDGFAALSFALVFAVLAYGLFADAFQSLERYTYDLGDRKSTRLNSSHVKISYAVFCLKKKKNQTSTSLT